MNIHEYQAKSILKKYNIAVPQGFAVHTAEEAEEAGWNIQTDIAVVKAQIHAGGRGKAGGVKVVKSLNEVKKEAEALLGKKLVTHQTGPEGREVKTLLIEEGCDILKEYYVAVTLDREASRVMIIASEEGGTDIEAVAAETPERIHREVIDPAIGLADFQARRLCDDIKIPSELIPEALSILKNLYRCFVEEDCSMAEINPLVTTENGGMMALDAKLSFDENALFRQPHLMSFRDQNEEDEKETKAAAHDLSYISLDGNIGCMVNGAGLAMATMDIIKYYGGDPANFLDVGGSATEEKVTEAFKIILSDTKVEGIFVNIFGGIMRCDIIAEGVLNAVKEINLQVPLVIRLEGTNVKEGRKLLEASTLSIHTVMNMDEGAKKIVELVKDKGGAVQ
ncbi:succinyl-CoA synthetase beta subunit [Tindallia magadiensis]|uniref:Succinate--CoA ligase [ADP-forming] subunit beta n=1 Tax=Tindallia magadiensis TaxID=69895 RepID=A0A1I3D7F3_9FIRM|nr:ADP-forming succinate--CoA ligase subunit beta [Tindallia magadiensis]SFH82617.1 succinyl-CoA synthetase beta subunit [Tindallia magadiensis]